MENKLYIIGHKNPDTDSICSALGYAAFKNTQGEEAVALRCGDINKETAYALEYFKVEAPGYVASLEENQAVALVDHNEAGQAVDGLDKASLKEIVDHHRLGGINTAEPIFVHIEPVGCTATIIANKFWTNNVEMEPAVAGVLLSAILSDTVLFKSPTCTEKDKATATKLATIAKVDLRAYGMEMLKAGAGVGDMTPMEIAKNDSKPFAFGAYKALVSQISVMAPEEVLAMKKDILAAMEELCNTEGYDLSLVMVTDIMEESTELLLVGQPEALVSKAFNKEIVENQVSLPGVMSRKKQIIPQLTEAANSL